MAKDTHLKYILLLLAISYVFLMLGNGILEMTNPDEVFYAQTAREMVQQKTWSVPYLFGQPQFEKPILTYWFLRLWFTVFDFSNFGARFFPALFGMLGVFAVYALAFLGFGDKKKAFICGLVLMSGGLYVGLSRTLFTDMIFSVLILLSLVSFYAGYVRPHRKTAGVVFFFVFAGLAVLAKGPLGLLIPAFIILVFLGYRKEWKYFLCAASFSGLLAFLLIVLPWYTAMTRKFGPAFIQEFYYNDHLRRLVVAEHISHDTWYFYPLGILASVFPWSFYLLAALFYLSARLKQDPGSGIYLFLSCWAVSVFFIFQAAHSKLMSYVLPMVPALAVLIGDFIHSTLSSGKPRKIFVLSVISWSTLTLLPVGLIVSTFRFSHYMPHKASVYYFAVFYVFLLAGMLAVILKRKFFAYLYLLAFQVPLLIFFTFFCAKDFQDFVSSKNPSAYLMRQMSLAQKSHINLKERVVENRILCAKPLARGVRFSTDKDVAVININGSNYFSPHPIPFLNSDIKVADFLLGQGVTYGILDKGALEDMERICQGRFKINELKQFGDQHVVEVRPI
jgi:hypothetical protein